MSKKPIFILSLCLGVFVALTACLAAGAPASQGDTPATLAAATVEAAQTQAAEKIATVKAAGQPPAAPTDTQAAPTSAPATAGPTATNEPPTVPTNPPLPTATPMLRIAYIKDGNVYLWTEGVGSIGLTSSGDATAVEISPDAAMIAYTRHTLSDYFHEELWVVNTTGATNARSLVSADELSVLITEGASGVGILQFAWRPGTHDLAYSTLPMYEGPGFQPNHDLRLVNTDTNAKTVLFEVNQGGFFYYSPDGSQIALSNPQSISLVNADGSNLRRDVVTFPLVGTFSEYQYHPQPLWASDSGSLRVAIPPADTMADPLPPTGLWKIPADGTPAEQLGAIQAMPFAWPDEAYAPDLQHVIYAMRVGDPTANQNELHIANRDGSGDSIYDSGESLGFTGWAPDALHFVYTINGGPRKGMYLGVIGGSTFLLASEPSSIRSLHWVDNQRFAYFLDRGSDQYELKISDTVGARHANIDTIIIPGYTPAMDVFRP